MPRLNKLYDETFTCNLCERILRIDRNFYNYKGSVKFCKKPIVPVCKECLQEFYGIREKQIGQRAAIREVLRKLDLPYLSGTVEKVIKHDNPIGLLFREYNSYSKYSNLSYDNSDSFPNFIGEEGTDDRGKPINTADLTPKDKVRWNGYGLSLEQMLYCKDLYDRIVSMHELKKINDLIAVEQYAATTVKMQEAYKQNSSTDIERYRKTLSAIENDLGIKSAQIKNDSDKESWGMFIKMVENDEPIEHCVPKDEFKDADKIDGIIKKWIIGYLPVMLGKQKPRDVLEDEFDVLDNS